MRRRSFFVGVPVIYAVTVYLALQGAQTRGESAEVLILVVTLSVAVGIVAWRFATRLETARAEAERGREELALVGQLSATLSGPLTAPAVATQFLSGIEALLPPAAVATLLQYEESAEAVRIIAQRGGGITPRPGLEYPVDALPPAMRTRLIGDQKSFVVDDTSAVPDWAALVARIPGLARAASFAAIPLVSRSRLRFWTNEPAAVTVTFGSRRAAKRVRAGYFTLPVLRGARHFTVVATDAVGNKTTLRG